MISRAELKRMAKEQIKGNLGILFLAGLIIMVIIYGLCAPMFVAQFQSILKGEIPSQSNMLLINIVAYGLTPSFIVGYLKMYLVIANYEKPTIGILFDGFKIWGKSTWLYIIYAFFTFLWLLLFIVPGIIKSISYGMSFFILAEKPYMTAREALNESKRIMHGHKMEFFVLGLSFIWWILLSGITFGLAYIYVIPYMYTTYTNFYNKIKDTN
jgi:uncharacterized membrane protein